jgi:DNA repair photolyase
LISITAKSQPNKNRYFKDFIRLHETIFMEFIQAKSILSKLKHAPDSWFGISYNMNLYRGCQHQCIYCDSRSECYRIADLSKIQGKENALKLLALELKRKKEKATIGTGSMNDPYMPIEKSVQLTRKALEIIHHYGFPIHIITKSDLVLRDLELIQGIAQKSYAAVSFTITTANDALSRIIEPAAPVPSERFTALKTLSNAGIYTGMLVMPVLPFITDTAENIQALVQKAKQAGVKYSIGSMGMTLRDRQRDYYYQKLDQHFPGLKEKYIARYGEQYGVGVPEAMALKNVFESQCKQAEIATKMEFYKPHKPEQLSLF